MQIAMASELFYPGTWGHAAPNACKSQWITNFLTPGLGGMVPQTHANCNGKSTFAPAASGHGATYACKLQWEINFWALGLGAMGTQMHVNYNEKSTC